MHNLFDLYIFSNKYYCIVQQIKHEENIENYFIELFTKIFAFINKDLLYKIVDSDFFLCRTENNSNFYNLLKLIIVPILNSSILSLDGIRITSIFTKYMIFSCDEEKKDFILSFFNEFNHLFDFNILNSNDEYKYINDFGVFSTEEILNMENYLLRKENSNLRYESIKNRNSVEEMNVKIIDNLHIIDRHSFRLSELSEVIERHKSESDDLRRLVDDHSLNKNKLETKLNDQRKFVEGKNLELISMQKTIDKQAALLHELYSFIEIDDLFVNENFNEDSIELQIMFYQLFKRLMFNLKCKVKFRCLFNSNIDIISKELWDERTKNCKHIIISKTISGKIIGAYVNSETVHLQQIGKYYQDKESFLFYLNNQEYYMARKSSTKHIIRQKNILFGFGELEFGIIGFYFDINSNILSYGKPSEGYDFLNSSLIPQKSVREVEKIDYLIALEVCKLK